MDTESDQAVIFSDPLHLVFSMKQIAVAAVMEKHSCIILLEMHRSQYHMSRVVRVFFPIFSSEDATRHCIKCLTLCHCLENGFLSAL